MSALVSAVQEWHGWICAPFCIMHYPCCTQARPKHFTAPVCSILQGGELLPRRSQRCIAPHALGLVCALPSTLTTCTLTTCTLTTCTLTTCTLATCTLTTCTLTTCTHQLARSHAQTAHKRRHTGRWGIADSCFAAAHAHTHIHAHTHTCPRPPARAPLAQVTALDKLGVGSGCRSFLDVGCGTGYVSALAACLLGGDTVEQNCSVHALECASSRLECARANLRTLREHLAGPQAPDVKVRCLSGGQRWVLLVFVHV